MTYKIKLGNDPEVILHLKSKPNVCPSCNHNIDPYEGTKQHWFTPEREDNYPDKMDVAYICPRNECRRMFIGIYTISTIRSGGNTNRAISYEFSDSLPIIPSTPNHDPEVVTISCDFVEIYRQAFFAEEYGLEDIAGGAYRKALEFLIKDYCTLKNPDKEQHIKNIQLGQVIGEYVRDPNLKSCAQRASWLGNDETHYVKKWIGKDIEDLKTLIRLTCNWIVSEVLTERYSIEMPKN